MISNNMKPKKMNTKMKMNKRLKLKKVKVFPVAPAPSPSPSPSPTSSKSEFKSIPESASISAVVIMYGWLGSQYKHVKKYAKLYEARGCHVVIKTSPVSTITRIEGPIRARVADSVREAARVVRTVEAACGGSREVPVVLHYFSNGGAYHAEQLGYMIQEATATAMSDNVGIDMGVGMDVDEVIADDLCLVADRLYHGGCEVLDSAPAYMSVKSGFNALNAAVRNYALLYFLVALLFLRYVLYRSVCWLSGVVNETDSFWTKMMDSDLCARQMFLFSDSDNITDSEKIKDLVELRKKRGYKVDYHNFRDSDHVMHMWKYKAEYDAVCGSVVETVMSSRS